MKPGLSKQGIFNSTLMLHRLNNVLITITTRTLDVVVSASGSGIFTLRSDISGQLNFFNEVTFYKHAYMTSCVIVCKRPMSLKSHLAKLRNNYVHCSETLCELTCTYSALREINSVTNYIAVHRDAIDPTSLIVFTQIMDK